MVGVRVCSVQFVPPFVVWLTAPALPVTQPTDELTKEMPRSCCVVPDVCAVQFVPPLVVWRTPPPVVISQPLFVSVKATP